MKTKSLAIAVDYCVRNHFPCSLIEQRGKYFHLPEREERHPTTMQRRKARPYEAASCLMRDKSSGRRDRFPADDYVGRTLKDKR